MASVNASVNRLAARLATQDPLMKATADKVQAIAKREAAKHVDSGDFESSIKQTRGHGYVRDFIVYTDDPLAITKEYGHTTPGGRFVPGIHAFGIALGEGARGV